MKKYLLGFLSLLITVNCIAAPPSRVSNYTSGTTIRASDVMGNENPLYSYLQAGVDTYSDGSIVNADISSSAAIGYSKLSLSSSITSSDIVDATIVNGDLSASLALPDSKLAQITTASKVSGAALTLFTSIPSGAGVIPTANLPAFHQPVIYTSSDTFVAPAGITGVFVTMVGGGGGGGGGGSGQGGGGGASGNYIINRYFSVTPSSSYTVTIGAAGTAGAPAGNGGAGGTTSFDTLSVSGGGGGLTAGTGGTVGSGGIAPSGSTAGGYNLPGTAGANNSGANGGGGAGSFQGAGGAGSTGGAGTGGSAAANSGAGGGGANNVGASNSGGAGGSGIVIVQY